MLMRITFSEIPRLSCRGPQTGRACPIRLPPAPPHDPAAELIAARMGSPSTAHWQTHRSTNSSRRRPVPSEFVIPRRLS